MKIYGPYTRKDGRKHVIHYDGQTRRTQSYPRYLIKQFLGRILETWEKVDHINENCSDDRIDNYQILTNRENVIKSCKPAEIYYFICPVCKNESSILMRYYRQNQLVQGKAGPYCSKSCAGKMHH